jgi:hypothetical protein
MAALTSDRNTEYSLGDLLSIPVAAGERIFAGSLVCSDSDGYGVPAADTAGLVFEGIATAQVDNRNGSAGDLSVVVRRRGRYKLDFLGAITQAGQSAKAYAVDDHTVDAADDVTNDVLVGIVDKVEAAGEAWVSIDAAVLAGKDWSEPTTTTTSGG